MRERLLTVVVVVGCSNPTPPGPTLCSPSDAAIASPVCPPQAARPITLHAAACPLGSDVDPSGRADAQALARRHPGAWVKELSGTITTIRADTAADLAKLCPTAPSIDFTTKRAWVLHVFHEERQAITPKFVVGDGPSAVVWVTTDTICQGTVSVPTSTPIVIELPAKIEAIEIRECPGIDAGCPEGIG